MANDLRPNQRQAEWAWVLTQAQQFISSGEFLPAAQLLARLSTESSQAELAATFEAARVLCISCAEHLRLANGHQTAVQQHQSAAQEFHDLIKEIFLAQLVVTPGQPLRPSTTQRRRRILRQLASLGGSPEATAVGDNSGLTRRDPSHETPTDISPRDRVDSATEVTVAVLGPLEVTIQGERVTGWGSQKSRTLFQYLVLHADRPARREVLMELLWPAHSSRSARNSLNVCLYGLRRSLHHTPPVDQYVVYRDGCYLLNPSVTWRIDRDEFLSLMLKAQAEARAGRVEPAIEHYQRAVAVYRGQLLEDDPKSDWFELERRSLQEHHLQALDDLALLHLRNQNVEAAHNIADRILRQDAGRESAHRVLMRCYSQQHQRSLVARQFRLCTTTLQRELGVSPTEETLRLFRELTIAP